MNEIINKAKEDFMKELMMTASSYVLMVNDSDCTRSELETRIAGLDEEFLGIKDNHLSPVKFMEEKELQLLKELLGTSEEIKNMVLDTLNGALSRKMLDEHLKSYKASQRNFKLQEHKRLLEIANKLSCIGKSFNDRICSPGKICSDCDFCVEASNCLCDVLDDMGEEIREMYER